MCPKPKKKPIKKPEEPESWEVESGMGIFPTGISFMQNVGCVGGKPKSVGNFKEEKP